MFIPAHSFLEGSQLLSLAGRHKVHISLQSNPLRLRVEGVEGALNEVGKDIERMKSVGHFPCNSNKASCMCLSDNLGRDTRDI